MTSKEMMGVDIDLNDNYNIIFNSNNAFAFSTSYHNLSQAIINRLLTPKGSNPFFPNYGSYLYRVNSKGVIESSKTYAQQVVYEALLQEPRISEINNIICDFNINGSNVILKIDITITPIDSVEPFNFVYDYFIN